MSVTFAQVWDVVAPFVAAALAVWFTYRFALRQRKVEIVIEQRLAAFNAIQAVLVDLLHYCEYSRHPGDDIGPDLPEGAPKSALQNAQKLSRCIDANRIYISRASRVELTKLCQSVSLAASMELAAMGNPEYEDRELYTRIRGDTDGCIELLHNELGLPHAK